MTPSTPVGDILADLPDHLKPVTLYQLATHTSGIRHYRGEGEANMAASCETPADALPLFVDDSLAFDPGTDRQYSSWAYVLLSAALAEKTGLSFAAFMQDEVFGPLAMTDVRASWTDHTLVESSVAVPYTRGIDGSFSQATSDISCKFGAGGFLASAENVVAFYRGLFSGDLLSERSRQLLLSTDSEGYVRQQGVGEGGRAQVIAHPSSGLVVAFTANASGDDVTFDRVFEVMQQVADRLGQ